MAGEGHIESIVTRSAEETQRFGASLADRLGPGDCVGLDGDLGAGKTCLIQGVCSGFGVEGPVTSPTFVLINEYEGRRHERPLSIFHFDLYRLAGGEDLIDGLHKTMHRIVRPMRERSRKEIMTHSHKSARGARDLRAAMADESYEKYLDE